MKSSFNKSKLTIVAKLPVTVVYKIDEDGNLQPNTEADRIMKDLFKKDCKQGELVEITYEIQNNDHSYGQLSKVKPMVRELAAETGVTFMEMEKIIKEKVGLVNSDGSVKSFGDCSKQEVSSAIQACEELMSFIRPAIDEQ